MKGNQRDNIKLILFFNMMNIKHVEMGQWRGDI